MGCSGDECVKSCDKWEQNGDHCYRWSSDKKNWTDAEDFCRDQGSHLAAVLSNATEEYVLQGMKNRGLDYLWLGGNDIGEEGAWKWTDCSPWKVTFWGKEEPNNGGQCLAEGWWNGKWNELHCNREVRFLCSKKICSGRTIQI